MNEAERKVACGFVLPAVGCVLYFLPSTRTPPCYGTCPGAVGGIGDGAYHGVPQDENGQLGVLFLHEINVLQAVPDEDVEI